MAPSHKLSSIRFIKEDVPEPWRMALLQRAIEKGVTYTLRCVHTGAEPKRFRNKDTGTIRTEMVKRDFLRTKFAGVERCFREGQEMELPAKVASFLWDKFNVNMVGGSIRHRSTNEAPFDRPCFEEVINEARTDLGPDVELRSGGVASQEDLLIERRPGAGSQPTSRAGSDEVTADEISQVARPAGGGGV